MKTTHTVIQFVRLFDSSDLFSDRRLTNLFKVDCDVIIHETKLLILYDIDDDDEGVLDLWRHGKWLFCMFES